MTELHMQGEVQSFDEDQRIISMKVVPWGVDAETNRGVESFQKGAFAELDPTRFILRPFHEDPPAGVGVSMEEKDDALYMDVRVAKTARGDETLELVRAGVTTGVSVEFEDGEVERTRLAGGRIRHLHKRVKSDGQLGIATTYKPAFREAAVLQTRERDDMAEEPTTGLPGALTAPQGTSASEVQELREAMMTRIDQLEEFQRANALQIPVAPEVQSTQKKVVLQLRELAEVITTDNSGVLPDTLSSEMIGRINTGRPFLSSTRQVPAPSAGTKLIFPKITQTPIVGVQAAEKDELASRKTIITNDDYGMITIGGAGDLSMQLIRRSSPEFLGLWLELLGEAYATMAEDKAIDALLAEAAVVEGGELDPAAPAFGGAFTNAAAATGRTMTPDRIWLSTAALAAFIDAVEPSGGGGRALYPGLASISGVTGGDGAGSGLGFSLRPVWVPELDDETPDIIVGPSRAFVWAEDGTYTLQADVPAKFGRDVGLAGMIWYAPIYPAAFTSYTLPS
jgi:phage head maturation protease